MAQLLIIGTHGTDDPTRASLPLHIAKGARDAGYDVAIALVADAPPIVKEGVRAAIQGVGMPSLAELFDFAVSQKIRFYV